ncbi:MAG: hypothetical protein ACM3SR_16600, partial [Ignavibacteriales bacterium]
LFRAGVHTKKTLFKGSYKAPRKASTKAILKDLLRKNLKLHPLIQERVDRFKQDWLNQKTVGVHIKSSASSNPREAERIAKT